MEWGGNICRVSLVGEKRPQKCSLGTDGEEERVVESSGFCWREKSPFQACCMCLSESHMWGNNNTPQVLFQSQSRCSRTWKTHEHWLWNKEMSKRYFLFQYIRQRNKIFRIDKSLHQINSLRNSCLGNYMMEYYSAIKNPIIKDLMKQKQIYDTGLKEKSKLQIDCVTRMANTSRIPASFKNNKE